MATFSTRYDSDYLDDHRDIEYGPPSPITGRDLIIGSGAAALDDFVSRHTPTIAESIDTLLGRNKTGPLSEAIARGAAASGDPKPPSAKSVARTLQRWKVWADGSDAEARTPKVATLNRYRAYYAQATGKPSAALDQVAGLVSGQRTTGQLPKGTLGIRVFGDIEAYPENPEGRPNRPAKITIDTGNSGKYAEALLNPIGLWRREFSRAVTPELYSVDWIEFSFTHR